MSPCRIISGGVHRQREIIKTMVMKPFMNFQVFKTVRVGLEIASYGNWDEKDNYFVDI